MTMSNDDIVQKFREMDARLAALECAKDDAKVNKQGLAGVVDKVLHPGKNKDRTQAKG